VIVIDGVRIGRGSVVAAGSVVTRDVDSFSVAAGVPARCVGFRRPRSAVEETA
jgi:acetyltransferase-like isoleucine patch superfamily enzyme